MFQFDDDEMIFRWNIGSGWTLLLPTTTNQLTSNIKINDHQIYRYNSKFTRSEGTTVQQVKKIILRSKRRLTKYKLGLITDIF